LKARLNFGPHISEDRLEEYAFARLPEAETAVVEEHLLVCDACQECLGDIDQYVPLMKVALAEPLVPKKKRRWTPFVVAGSIAAALVAGLGIAMTKRVAPSETVDLVALRGPGSGLVHAGNSAVFRIESPDLADGPYRLEIVNASGTPIWSGATQASGGRINAAEPKSLKPGQYWVRLYSLSGLLLREFGLESVR
jgi:Putative zinc-finger